MSSRADPVNPSFSSSTSLTLRKLIPLVLIELKLQHRQEGQHPVDAELLVFIPDIHLQKHNASLTSSIIHLQLIRCLQEPYRHLRFILREDVIEDLQELDGRLLVEVDLQPNSACTRS